MRVPEDDEGVSHLLLEGIFLALADRRAAVGSGWKSFNKTMDREIRWWGWPVKKTIDTGQGRVARTGRGRHR